MLKLHFQILSPLSSYSFIQRECVAGTVLCAGHAAVTKLKSISAVLQLTLPQPAEPQHPSGLDCYSLRYAQ